MIKNNITIAEYNMASARIKVLLAKDSKLGSDTDLYIMQLGRLMEDFQTQNPDVSVCVETEV